MLEERVRADLVNRRQYRAPKWKRSKRRLPQSEEYRSVKDWLSAVQEEVGEDMVFALDSALMCDGSYLGRMNEWIIWVYGPKRLMNYSTIKHLLSVALIHALHMNSIFFDILVSQSAHLGDPETCLEHKDHSQR